MIEKRGSSGGVVLYSSRAFPLCKGTGWAAFRALITVENAGVYDSIQLMGYSFTGRAETRMATVVF